MSYPKGQIVQSASLTLILFKIIKEIDNIWQKEAINSHVTFTNDVSYIMINDILNR